MRVRLTGTGAIEQITPVRLIIVLPEPQHRADRPRSTQHDRDESDHEPQVLENG